MAPLRSFASSPLPRPFPLRLLVNPANQGSRAAFERAIGECRGVIIALADQDDVWRETKLARLEEMLTSGTGGPPVSAPDDHGLAAHATAGPPQPAHRRADPALAFSDADVVDESLAPAGQRLWQILGPNPHQRRSLASGDATPLLRQNLITGATLAFRAEFRPLILPIPPGWHHDAWIALILSAVSRAASIDQPLLQYRQHPHQLIGAARHTLRQQWRTARQMGRAFFAQEAAAWQAARDRLRPLQTRLNDPTLLRRLEEKAAHCQARLQLRGQGWGRIVPILRQALGGHYRRYSLGWKSIAQDLFLPGA